MELEWRHVAGYEGFYQVSSCGVVRSVDRVFVRVDGKKMRKRETVLSPYINHKGYKRVVLFRNDKCRKFFIHSLVAAAFLPEKPTPLHEVNHIDGIKTNNHKDNLEWVTRSENHRHAIRLGLIRYRHKKNATGHDNEERI